MYKTTILFTPAEARQMLERRGIRVEERKATRYDGDFPVVFSQFQAWNPFRLEWVPLDDIFPQVLGKAAAGLIAERISGLPLDEFFKP